MLLVEVSDQLGIHDVTSTNPGPLLWTVSLPVQASPWRRGTWDGPHGPLELEFHCCQSDDLLDGEGAHEPRRQLPELHLKRQVPGGEPHPLANPVNWSRGPTAISLYGIVAYGAQKGRPRQGPRPIAELIRELWAYFTHTRMEDHEVGYREVMQWSPASRFWFFLSVCPLDCG